jgi:hypothetical protein
MLMERDEFLFQDRFASVMKLKEALAKQKERLLTENRDILQPKKTNISENVEDYAGPTAVLQPKTKATVPILQQKPSVATTKPTILKPVVKSATTAAPPKTPIVAQKPAPKSTVVTKDTDVKPTTTTTTIPKDVDVKNPISKKVKKMFPELKGKKLNSNLSNIDIKNRAQVDSKIDELTRQMIDEYMSSTESIVKLNNKYGIQNQDMKKYFLAFREGYEDSVKYSENTDPTQIQFLKQKCLLSKQKFYDETTKIVKKLGLVSKDTDTNSAEFKRKTYAINTSINIFRQITETYAGQVNRLMKFKTSEEIMQELQKIEFTKDEKTLDKTMFSNVKPNAADSVFDNYSMDQLYEKIKSIELLNLSDYLNEMTFGYKYEYNKNLMRLFVDEDPNLKAHYSEVLKILIVYLGLVSKFLKILNNLI